MTTDRLHENEHHDEHRQDHGQEERVLVGEELVAPEELALHFLERTWYNDGDLDLEDNEMQSVLERCTALMRLEKNVVDVHAQEAIVIGDLHGQFDDLLAIVMRFLDYADGFVPQRPMIFLGDYVDRGSESAPVMALLSAFKIMAPDRVFLLRGNHETRAMTGKAYGDGVNFQDELWSRYPDSNDVLINTAFAWFDALPVAAIIHLSDETRYFCVHGGIPKRIGSIEEINHLDRFAEPPLKGPMCDLMWADPIDEKHAVELSHAAYEEFLLLDYIPNIARGCSSLFGYASLSSFLHENQLVGVIRGHQVAPNGFKTHFSSLRGRKSPVHPPLTTVFSASNYCGTYGNKAAVAIARVSGLVREEFRDQVEVPSEQFLEAMREDESNEKHPGWLRLRSCLATLSLFNGVMNQSEKKQSLDALTKQLTQHAEDTSGQLRDLWQTLDTNNDGLLSAGEMAEFAMDFVAEDKSGSKALKIAKMVSNDWQEAMGVESSVSYEDFKEYVRALNLAVLQ